MKSPLTLLVAFGLAIGQIAVCGIPANGRVVKLSSGVNRIQLPGGKSECMAVLSHRENFNAHGFDIFSIYIKDLVEGENVAEWSSVTFFDGEKERFVLTVGGGADCLLHDFRLVTPPAGKSLRLVLADRELGGSFADEDKVTFSFFELRKNARGEVGRPLYYFERVRVETAKKKYCDVGEAFKVELGLNNYMARPQ